MHSTSLGIPMRGYGLALALALALAPVAAAERAETIRRCSELGCVVVVDTDEDGAYDWANVAIVPGNRHLFGVSANLNRTDLDGQAFAGTEEALPHELGVHEFYVVTLDGETHGATTVTRAGFGRGDEETGLWEDVAMATLSTQDLDADGRPDRVELVLLLP